MGVRHWCDSLAKSELIRAGNQATFFEARTNDPGTRALVIDMDLNFIVMAGFVRNRWAAVVTLTNRQRFGPLHGPEHRCEYATGIGTLFAEQRQPKWHCNVHGKLV